MDKRLLHTVFEDTVSRFPSHVAIEQGKRTITFEELNERANQLAHYLQHQGLPVEGIVGVCLPPSIEYVASLLGIMKAGGVFFPLESTLPEKRLSLLLEKATPFAYVVTPEQVPLLKRLTAPFTEEPLLIVLSPEGTLSSSYNESFSAGYKETDLSTVNLPIVPTPEGSCYLIFTSGSTGDPKAIVGCHKGLSHFIHWEGKEFAIDETVRVSFLAAPTFDVSLRDIFLPLTFGGTLCIPTAEIKTNALQLLTWLRESRVSLIHCVPSLLRVLLKEIEQEGKGKGIASLQYLFSAGEALYGRDLQLARTCLGETVEIINLYGPSETTLAKAFFRTGRTQFQPNDIVPIGNPISNAALLIIKDGLLCQPGETGEIYIKTPFMSKGYLRDPELTRTCFIPSPLTGDETDIVYKTGDLGRYRDDRSIEIIGRLDRQVKINGIRVELTEVEKAVHSHPHIKQNLVLSHKGSASDQILLCYYTENEAITAENLRTFLAESLPSVMIPSFFIRLENFPLNVNGKIDRKALPKPEDLIYQHTLYEEPVTDTEKTIAALWAELLALPKVGRKNTFLELGGDSLKAIRLVSKISKKFSVNITLRQFFEHTTVAQQALLVTQGAHEIFSEIRPIPSKEYYSLSAAQRRLWIVSQLQENLGSYNISDAFLIKGTLCVEALEEAFTSVIARHESLRTTFELREQEPVQRVHAPFQLAVEKIDLSQEKEKQQRLPTLLEEKSKAPFNLSELPLLRLSVIKLSDNESVLLSVIHHSIADGWSLGVLVKEILTYYHSSLHGVTPSLPLLPLQYRDYAAWQEEYLTSKEAKNSREYWCRKLSGELPLLELPLDFPRQAVQTFNGSTLCFALEDADVRKLKDLAQREHASVFMALQTVVKGLLYRYTEETDIIVGTPVAGRSHPELEGQIGCYVNILALRDTVVGTDSFFSLLQKVRETTIEAFEHQLYPFDKLVEDLSLPRNASRSPLYEVMVALQNMERVALSLSGLEVKEYPMEEAVSKNDLSFLFIEERKDSLQVRVNFNTDLFKKERIERMCEHFKVLLKSILAQPEMSFNDQELLTNEEQHEFAALSEVSSTDKEETVVDLFRQKVKCFPHKIAATGTGFSWSYAELDTYSDLLAEELLSSSLSLEEPVPVLMERTPLLIAAILGIMKAGGAYLPIDPKTPSIRISAILRECGAKRVLTDTTSCSFEIPFYDIRTLLQGVSRKNIPLPQLSSSHLAYLIYTSGSTGTPKGVMVEHGGLANTIRAQIDSWKILREDVVLQFASQSFDASISDIFIGLVAGATIAIVQRDIIDNLSSFKDFLITHNVTIAILPPTYISLLQRDPLPSLTTIISAGEAAHVEDLLWYAKTKQVINGYGPSECSICVSSHTVDPSREYGVRIPIGLPIANTQLFILSSALAPVPWGAVGEICAAGKGVGRGYFGRPELTAQKFVHAHGKRLYRTGDFGRRLEDGTIEYLGRRDTQVKIAGHRIELDEIRAVCCEHPGVTDATVTVYTHNGTKALVGYYVAGVEELNEATFERTLRKHLGERLPRYMVPQYLLPIPFIPMTLNGKVHVAALPSPHASIKESSSVPMTEEEKLLYSVWKEVLGRDTIGIQENFFSLGGDSIKAIQIAGRLAGRGYKISVREILEASTIADLAPRLTKKKKGANQEHLTGTVPLSPIQLWFFKTFKGHLSHFNQSVLLQWKGRVNEDILRKALSRLQLHHDALRATFTLEGDVPLQQIADASHPTELHVYELCGTDEKKKEEMFSQLQSSLKLTTGPLFKGALVRCEENDEVLLMAHHLVVDTVSWRFLLEDLYTCYHHYSKEETVALPEKTDSYGTFTTALYEFAQGELLRKETEYWKAITSLPLSPIVSDREEADHSRAFTTTQSFTLSKELTTNLLGKAHHAYSTQVPELLLTALGRALYQWRGRQHTVLSLEGHGREELLDGVDITRTVGWFTSCYPFLLTLPPTDDVGYQVRAIKENLRKVPNKGIGYGILRYLTSQGEGIQSGDRAQISFNYLGQFAQEVQNDLFEISQGATGGNVSTTAPRPHDLSFEVYVLEGACTVTLGYSSQQYLFSTVEDLLTLFNEELQRVISHCIEQETRALTPSDLTYSELSIEELDTLLEDITS